MLEPGVRKIGVCRDQADPDRGPQRRRRPARASAVARRERRHRARPGPAVRARRRIRDCGLGCAAQVRRARADPRLYPPGRGAGTRLGAAAGRAVPAREQWERLLNAGLARDFEQLRIEFLSRIRGKAPDEAVDDWIEAQRPRIEQFRKLIGRARGRGPGQRADACPDREPGPDPARPIACALPS